jgi:hypothetical protein|tara:strand:+ start:1310 stop:2026 length:717 start_codon:yes stop_codon:yes gene_type:complete
MKYYFSSPTPRIKLLRQNNVKNYLYSFATDSTGIKNIQKEDSIIIDSGSFSLWNTGKIIDIDDYLNFCKLLPKKFIFVNLDVIPKTNSNKKKIGICIEKSIENFLYLKKHLKNVMPVYHYGEDISILKKYEENTDYVGISPANDTSEKVKRSYLNYVFKNWNKQTKYHGFGYSSFSGLEKYPYYSVDSISYIQFQVGKKRYRHSDKLSFFTNKSIKKFKAYEKYITKLWKKRGITWNE